MKKTIDASDLKNEFESYNRDYYSYEACQAMIDYYDKCGEEMELDVIAICGDWTEYEIKDLLNDFDHMLDEEAFEDMTDEEIAEYEPLTDDEKAEQIVEKLQDETYVIELSGSWLVAAF